jgi:hypothetical protein
MIGALRIELLQSLTLHGLHSEDAEGHFRLGKVSGLTKLCISTSEEEEYIGPSLSLSQALAALTRLRSLEIYVRNLPAATKALDLSLALRPLTALTYLELHDAWLDNGDLRALLVLTGLRKLTVYGSHVTDEVVPELIVLTNLSSLTLGACKVTSLKPVRRVLDPLREARGWRTMFVSHDEDE